MTGPTNQAERQRYAQELVESQDKEEEDRHRPRDQPKQDRAWRQAVGGRSPMLRENDPHNALLCTDTLFKVELRSQQVFRSFTDPAMDRAQQDQHTVGRQGKGHGNQHGDRHGR